MQLHSKRLFRHQQGSEAEGWTLLVFLLYCMHHDIHNHHNQSYMGDWILPEIYIFKIVVELTNKNISTRLFGTQEYVCSQLPHVYYYLPCYRYILCIVLVLWDIDIRMFPLL